MSLTIIVLVSAVMAALIGLKIYFEYNQEKELEKAQKDLEKEVKNTEQFTQEEIIAAHQPVAVEEVPKNQLKLDFETPVESAAIVEVEPINSAAALAETKPKKKKHYYPKKKKAAIKAKPKNQTKK